MPSGVNSPTVRAAIYARYSSDHQRDAYRRGNVWGEFPPTRTNERLATRAPTIAFSLSAPTPARARKMLDFSGHLRPLDAAHGYNSDLNGR